jgi:hypothetical protein
MMQKASRLRERIEAARQQVASHPDAIKQLDAISPKLSRGVCFFLKKALRHS